MMTSASDFHAFRLEGLPDPGLDRQFYDGVPARRLVAWCIDLAVVLALSLVLVPVFGILTLGLGFFVAPLVFMAISFVYRVATLSARSATWGMRLMGIELRRGDGRRLDPLFAFLHVGLYTATIALPLLALGSIIAVLITRYQQTLPDLALGTTAINRPED
jgi:uncharacterized RDD family membrane protein YckC